MSGNVSHTHRLISGADIVLEVERRVGSTLVCAGRAWSAATGPNGTAASPDRMATGPNATATAQSGDAVKHIPDAAEAVAYAAGMTAGGLRSALLVNGSDLPRIRPALREAAERRLPLVVHCVLETGHDEYLDEADGTIVQMLASDVQEAKDMALVARRLAEEALVPVLCAQDRLLTAEAMQTIALDDESMTSSYAGMPSDLIDPPTAAQQLLWSGRRRRVPMMTDLDHPAGLGAKMEDDAAFQSRSAASLFYADAYAQLTDNALNAFAAETGRTYDRIDAHRTENADVLLLSQGTLARDVRHLVDELRTDGVRAGAVGLRTFRPFPAELLAPILASARAVTILECSARASAGHRLAREVRAALQERMASTTESEHRGGLFGSSPARTPFLPTIYEGTYGTGGAHPSVADLRAVFANMQPEGRHVHEFFVGARFDRSDLRVPLLERQQQQIRRSYSAALRRSISGLLTSGPAADVHRSVQIRAMSPDTAHFAGTLAARMVFSGGSPYVLAHPDQDAGHPAAAGIYTVTYSDRPIEQRRHPLNALVLESPAYLENHALRDDVADGALVVTDAQGPVRELPRRLPAPVRDWIRDHDIRLVALDVAELARETADDELFARALTVPVLLGALFGSDGIADREHAHRETTTGRAGTAASGDGTEGERTRSDISAWPRHYHALADAAFGSGSRLATLHAGAFAVGADQAASVAIEALEFETGPAEHPPTPAAAREATQGDTLMDLGRFWKTTGYLHRLGERNGMVADVHLASAVVPAHSSVVTLDGRTYDSMPRIDGSRCTGCGTCWTVCPDAALVPAVRSMDDLIETAIAADGGAFLQLSRLSGHLAKSAHKIVAKDDLRRHATLDAVLDEAMERILAQVDVEGPQRDDLVAEYARLRKQVVHLPVVRTERFFDEPDAANKGSGEVFCLAVDADACKACGICATACPEDVVELTHRTADVVTSARDSIAFLTALPALPWERVEALLDDDPETTPFAFLDRRVQRARIGGDDRPPGDGSSIALRLFASAAETSVRPRAEALRRRIEALIGHVETAIQGALERSVHVNDLDAFRARLRGTDPDGIDAGDLVYLAAEADQRPAPNVRRLTRLADVLADLRRLRDVFDPETGIRAHTVAAFEATARPSQTPSFPSNPYPFPWISFGRAPAAAEGLFEGVMAQMAVMVALMRRAELLVNDDFERDVHDDLLANLSWSDFTEEERLACPPVIAVADADADLRGLLERGTPLAVIQICGLEHPVYQPLAWVEGRDAFLLQGSIGYPRQLLRGFLDGLSFDGPRVFRVYAADPERDDIPARQTVEQSRLAVLSRAFPLLRYDPRRGTAMHERLDLSANPNPDERWAHSDDDIFTVADWASREGRFFRHLELVPRRLWSPDMLPVSRYLDLPPDERSGRIPFIASRAADGSIIRKRVREDLIELVQRRIRTWRLLQEASGVRSSLADRLREEARADADSRLDAERALLERQLADRSQELERSADERYRDRLAGSLLELSGFDADHLEQTLSDYAGVDPNADADDLPPDAEGAEASC